MIRSAALLCLFACGSAYAQPAGQAPDVLFQGFYWNVHPGDHATDAGGVWWDSLAVIAPRLAAGGVQTVWIPSPAKGGSGRWSMGYDPYDYYDLGAIDQKGSVRTRFGTEAQLRAAVAAMKGAGLRVMADVVLNHRDGADAQGDIACVPPGMSPFQNWNVFTPGSGRFPADSLSFHPNPTHCDLDAPYHDAPFGQDLGYFHDTDDVLDAAAPGDGWYHGRHSLGFVGDSLVVWGRWLLDDLGADEIRLDAIKHIEPGFLAPWIAEVSAGPQPFTLGENWSSTAEILAYHGQVASFNTAHGGTRDAQMAMFDFGLRYALRDLANGGGAYDARALNSAGLHFSGASAFDVVTFVENHDVDRIGWVWADCAEPGAVQTGATCVKPGTDSGHDPIVARKNLGYAVVMAAEGRPTVFWKDYLWYGLGAEIDWLMALRRLTAQGESTPMSGLAPFFTQGTDQDGWALRREGYTGGDAPRYGSVMMLSDGGDAAAWVDTPHASYALRDYSDAYAFETTTAFADGRALVKARGGDYAWWAPTGLYPRAVDAAPSAFALTAAPGGLLHHVVLRASDAASLRVNGAPIQPGDEVAVLAPGGTAANGEVAGIGRVGQRLRWDGVHDLVIEVLGNGADVGADASRLGAGDALRLVVFDADTQTMHEAGAVAWAASGTAFTHTPLRPASRGGAFATSATGGGAWAAGAVSLVTAFSAGAATPSVVLRGAPGWRMLALPYADLGLGGNGPDGSGRSEAGLFQPIYTAGYAGADRDQNDTQGLRNVFLFDEPTATYPGPVTSGGVPHGRGLWVYVFEDDDPHTAGTQGGWPKVLPAAGTALAADHDFGISSTPGAPFPGTNLLGNPYDQNLAWDHPDWTKTDVATTVYVYDPTFNGGSYRGWTTGVGGTLAGGEIPVGQGFFAYALGASAALIAPAAGRTGEWLPLSGAREAQAPDASKSAGGVLPHVRLTLAGRAGASERTATLALAVAPDAALGRDARDAVALAEAPGADALRLAAAGPDGAALAVSTVPGEATVAVHADALAAGAPADAAVTLAWAPVALPDGWTALLADRATGQTHDLTAAGEVRVQLRAADAAVLAPAAADAKAGAEVGATASPPVRPLALDADAARFTVTLRPTGATAAEPGLAAELTLGTPEPNPARDRVRLPFSLAEAADVRLVAYDALGRQVAVVAEGARAAGAHAAVLDASRLAPGVYVVRLTVGAEARTARLTVVR